MKDKTFKGILASVPKPRMLSLHTELPYVFDLHWDVKTVWDLWAQSLTTHPDVLRLLAEAGFDAKSLVFTQKDYEDEMARRDQKY